MRKTREKAVKFIIIDKSRGYAEVLCDQYGDYETFETHEAAECFRAMYCDEKLSYVFPKKVFVKRPFSIRVRYSL